MKKLVFFLFKIISKIYPYSISVKINYKFDLIYSLWLSNFFKSENLIFFCYPAYLKGMEYIIVGENCCFDKRFRLEAWDKFADEVFSPKIIIGKNVYFGLDCHIGAIDEIVVGDGVLVGSKVYITDHFHGEINAEDLRKIPKERSLYSKGKVIIGDNVWIGEGVVVLPNVHIGKNTIVGANSVVTKSFPDNCVIAGNPAKLIRYID